VQERRDEQTAEGERADDAERPHPHVEARGNAARLKGHIPGGESSRVLQVSAKPTTSPTVTLRSRLAFSKALGLHTTLSEN
jgi:hypothetical protein